MLNVISFCLVDLNQYLRHKNVEIYLINLAKSPHFCGEIYLTTIPSSTLVKTSLICDTVHRNYSK